MRQVAELVAAGNEVAITHGNGPQVGNLLVKNEISRYAVPPCPSTGASRRPRRRSAT